MVSVRRARLRVRGGPASGGTLDLAVGVTMMGRAPVNDIVVEESWVSRQHAAIRGIRSGYWIEDLGSRHGTFVNGERVEGEGQRLHNKDRIELGRTGTKVHWVFEELEATEEIPRASRA